MTTRHISDFTPDISNANRGTERGRALLEQSLRQYGAGRSILVDREGRIIAGNKTLETAGAIGLEDVIVVQTDGKSVVAVQRMDLDLATDEAARMLAYADNRVGEIDLDFDPEQLLADMTAGLPLEDFWRKDELDALLAEIMPPPAPVDAEPQIDRAEELRQLWGVELGQMWQLDSGNGHPHRLICGDCTDPATVARVMGGEKADCVYTDPPYGVGYVGGTGRYANRQIKSNTQQGIRNDDDCKLYAVAFDLILSLLDSGAAYVWFADKVIRQVIALMPSNLELRRVINWYKIEQGFGDMGSDYHCVSEPCLYLVKGKSNFVGPNNETNVWEFQRPQKNELHPTQKPVELAVRAIGNHAANIVFDGFLGSGTTLIACENLSRQCRAVEIAPGYVAVCLQRWADATSCTPVLLES